MQQASYDAPDEEDKEILQASSEDGEEGTVHRSNSDVARRCTAICTCLIYIVSVHSARH